MCTVLFDDSGQLLERRPGNRNPLAKADTVFVNNVLYNYSAGYTTHTSTATLAMR